MKSFEEIYRLNESVLKDAATFYSAVSSELHDIDNVQIWSDEPLGSNFSCFDYSHEGDDRTEEDKKNMDDRRFRWNNCKLTMDDDGLYWESKKGKNAALTIYAIKKVELKPHWVTVWVAPTDSSDQMAVIEFFTDKMKDPIYD